VLHFHTDYWPFSLFTRQSTPFLNASLVSISDSQRVGLPGASYVGTEHHGLPAGLLSPVPGIVPEYLAFLGRITPEKGPDRAIRIARAAGIPLKISAKVSNAHRPWYDAVIRPMIVAGGVEMVGEISDGQKAAFLSGALGLLMPVNWPEPFGLAMIEAMRPADADSLTRFDLGAQAGNRPVRPVGNRLFEQGRDHAQRGFALHRRQPRRDVRLQRIHTAPAKIAAPQPNRVLPHTERFRDLPPMHRPPASEPAANRQTTALVNQPESA
jgi:hypothetical protein